MVWSCPEYGTLVRIMLLLYGEETTTFTGLIYGRSGSRTLTTQLLLLSTGGYPGVKVPVKRLHNNDFSVYSLLRAVVLQRAV